MSKLQQLLAESESNVFVENLIGEVYLFKKEPDKAIQTIQSAIDKKPDWPLPYRNLANAHILKNDTESAIQAYQLGIDATGFAPILVTDLARYFELNNEIDKAISLYESVLVQDEQNKLAANNLAMLLIDYRGDEKSLNRAAVSNGKSERRQQRRFLRYDWLVAL